MAFHLPAIGLEMVRKCLKIFCRCWGLDGFSNGQFAELARLAVVDPAHGGLQGRPLPSPAAEDQGKAQQQQQGQKPVTRINVIQLQAQQDSALD